MGNVSPYKHIEFDFILASITSLYQGHQTDIQPAYHMKMPFSSLPRNFIISSLYGSGDKGVLIDTACQTVTARIQMSCRVMGMERGREAILIEE